jgi:ribosomal protein S18 acetylase RimI-like enzyme
VTIREATEADLPRVREFVAAYQDEFWERPYPAPPLPEEWLREGRILLLERDGEVQGMAKGDLRHGIGRVSLVYLIPQARSQGLGKALLRELATFFKAAGVEYVTLGVDVTNEDAFAVWRRLGFIEYQRELVSELGALEARLGETHEGPSFGAVHVQTDDQAALERAVARFVPRLFVSGGTVVSAAHNGWVTIYDEAAGRDPALLRRLARELSNITGGVVFSLGVEEGEVVRLIAFERGRLMDEYLSIPGYYGAPPGDAVALRANPTILGRLTGRSPEAIRAVAQTADSPVELPAAELLERLEPVLGLDGVGLSFDEARSRDGALLVEHGR